MLRGATKQNWCCSPRKYVQTGLLGPQSLMVPEQSSAPFRRADCIEYGLMAFLGFPDSGDRPLVSLCQTTGPDDSHLPGSSKPGLKTGLGLNSLTLSSGPEMWLFDHSTYEAPGTFPRCLLFLKKMPWDTVKWCARNNWGEKFILNLYCSLSWPLKNYHLCCAISPSWFSFLPEKRAVSPSDILGSWIPSSRDSSSSRPVLSPRALSAIVLSWGSQVSGGQCSLLRLQQPLGVAKGYWVSTQ